MSDLWSWGSQVNLTLIRSDGRGGDQKSIIRGKSGIGEEKKRLIKIH